MSVRDRESKSTINTNINHILLFFFYSLSFPCRYLLSKSDILWRRWSPPKLCCPDISRVIDHAGNTVTLTKACRLKYITLKQEVIHHGSWRRLLLEIWVLLRAHTALPSAWMLTALKNFLFFLHPSTDTILSVVSSEIFGIIGVPSSQLSVCPVQEVEPLCPTAVQLCQWAFMSACLVPSPAPIPLWLLQISPDFQSEVQKPCMLVSDWKTLPPLLLCSNDFLIVSSLTVTAEHRSFV